MHFMSGHGPGTLVMVERIMDGGDGMSIAYVTPEGYEGGSSSWWPLDELRPITEPALVLAAQLHHARARAAASKSVQRQAMKRAKALECALGALKAAQEEARGAWEQAQEARQR